MSGVHSVRVKTLSEENHRYPDAVVNRTYLVEQTGEISRS